MRISQNLSSRFDAVPGFITGIIGLLQKEFVISEEDIFNIRLALEEAVSNAIKHGNRLDPSLGVEVAVDCDGNNLTMVVKDHGQGFDFDKVPDPMLPQRRMHSFGRGIFLMKKVMDEVSFHDGGRSITMIKKLRR